MKEMVKDFLKRKVSKKEQFRSKRALFALSLDRNPTTSSRSLKAQSKENSIGQDTQRSLFDRHISVNDLWKVAQINQTSQTKHSVLKTSLNSIHHRIPTEQSSKVITMGVSPQEPGSQMKTSNYLINTSSRVHKRTPSLPNFAVKVKLSKELARLHKNSNPQTVRKPFMVFTNDKETTQKVQKEMKLLKKSSQSLPRSTNPSRLMFGSQGRVNFELQAINITSND